MDGPAPSGAAPSGGEGTAPAASAGAGTSAPVAQPTGQAAPQGTAPAAAARAPMMIKHRATIGDQEHELDIDIADHLHGSKHRYKADGGEHETTFAEMLERMPLAHGAHTRMQKAAKAAQEADARETALKDHERQIIETLRHPERGLGLLERFLGGRENALRAMDAYVQRHQAELALTPEQRARRDDESRRRGEIEQNGRQLTEREQTLAAREKAIQDREAAALTESFKVSWPKALAAAGVPETPGTIRRMSIIMQDAAAAGFRMTEADAARELAEQMRGHFGGMDATALRAAAPDAASALERQRIEQLNASQPGRVASSPARPAPTPAKMADPREAESWEEYTDRVRRASDERDQAALRAGSRRIG